MGSKVLRDMNNFCGGEKCHGLSSLISGWLQQQSIDLKMAALLREIGEHKGRAEFYGVHALTVIDSLREMTAEHSAASANRMEGMADPREQANYKGILLKLQGSAGKSPLSADGIKTIHATLFRGTDSLGSFGGQCGSAEADERLAELCLSYNKLEKTLEPLLLVGACFLELLCLRPFDAGNDRVAQLTAAWLLQRRGYGVSRFVSLERMMEESKKEYAEARKKSSTGWAESRHDIRPWWNYWLKLLARAYRDLTARARILARRKGVKTELVLDAMKAMGEGFTLRQIQQRAPECGIELIRKICKAEKAAGRIQCLGRGPNALWRVKK